MTSAHIPNLMPTIQRSRMLDKPDNFTGQQILNRSKGGLNKNKITWEKLDNITFKDLNMLFGGTGKEEEVFNPKELFEDGRNTADDEDNFYLAEFDLNNAAIAGSPGKKKGDQVNLKKSS